MLTKVNGVGEIGRALVELDVARLEASALESDNGDPFVLEVGYRAWTWGHDVNEFEANTFEDVRTMIGRYPAGKVGQSANLIERGW